MRSAGQRLTVWGEFDIRDRLLRQLWILIRHPQAVGIVYLRVQDGPNASAFSKAGSASRVVANRGELSKEVRKLHLYPSRTQANHNRVSMWRDSACTSCRWKLRKSCTHTSNNVRGEHGATWRFKQPCPKMQRKCGPSSEPRRRHQSRSVLSSAQVANDGLAASIASPVTFA